MLVIKTSAQNTQNPDSLFSMARTAAYDHKDYSSAITLSKQALQIAPNYTDIAVFLGRIYTWNKQTDSARYYFDLALQQKPGYEDALSAYADLEFWNKNDSAALALANEGLAKNPTSQQLLVRKATVLESMRQYEEAALLADSVLTLDKGNQDARALLTRLYGFLSKNRVGIKYDYTYFDEQFPDPWHMLAVDYTRQTNMGSITARVNYANRFANDAVQYELETYPRISRTFYAYVAAAYSSDTIGIFPKWRLGASLFANLPHAFEAEAGIRYLYFAGDANGTDFYTLYLGKYYHKFLFGARVYLTPNPTATSQSYNAIARYYFGGADDYLNFLVGYGISPDDRNSAPLININTGQLKSYRGELIFRKLIKRMNILTLNLSLQNQEFTRGTEVIKGNQIQAGIGYIRRF
ncbi:YaiO family outer membrane beta-barrel protein [Polluticoccus soli]|uniref:YaiO family outer membrane beta-barrel protein n=1 Tax=Polluticoccus soli TaxID=3034150 RepID=UPI0023E0ABEC|nr:YaiO family outer membrane beta-barrel protein [Flavipsychrobacter sp. JY13-12]